MVDVFPPHVDDRTELESLRAENAELRERLAEREWKPIESAPKTNGRGVLVLHEGKHVHIAAHATYYSEFLRAEMTGWWDRQDWFLKNCTHWMPLPSAPATRNQEPA